MQPTSLMEWALWNAERGFRVFPIKPGAKYPPLMKRPYEHATTDPGQVMLWWLENPDANIGIDTSDLLVVDVDKKGNRDGYQALHALGIESDDTYVVSTPSGGQHRYYRVDHPVAGSVETLGVGVDTRGFHNYVLGAGSVTAAGRYDPSTDGRVIQAPECVRTRTSPPKARDEAPLIDLDTPSAIALAREFARNAEPAIEGERGDEHTYKVACRVREFGVSEDMCFEILLDLWNETCDPPWEPDHLRKKVESAYLYGIAQPGSAHPDVLFESVNVDPEPQAPMPSSKWWNAEDYDDDFDDEWLFWEVAPKVGVGLLISPPSGGKTTVETHLADCIRTGDKFFGVDPDVTGSSIILASEAFPSLKKRLRALRKTDTPNRIHARPVAALASPRTWAGLCDEVISEAETLNARFGEPVRLICLDTLAASGMLADENDNAQAALCMTLLAGLAQRLQCFVLVTHHTTKSGKTERGASALRGGADSVWEIQHDENSPVYTLEQTKNRDGPTKSIGCFTLEPKVLKYDSRGRPVTTAEISTGAPAPKRPSGRPVKADKFMEALDNTISVPNGSDVRDGAVKKYDLRKEFRQAAGFPDGKSQNGNVKSAFDRCVTYFLSTAEIECVLLDGVEFIRKKDITI